MDLEGKRLIKLYIKKNIIHNTYICLIDIIGMEPSLLLNFLHFGQLGSSMYLLCKYAYAYTYPPSFPLLIPNTGLLQQPSPLILDNLFLDFRFLLLFLLFQLFQWLCWHLEPGGRLLQSDCLAMASPQEIATFSWVLAVLHSERPLSLNYIFFCASNVVVPMELGPPWS